MKTDTELQFRKTNSVPLTCVSFFLELLVQMRKDQKYSELPKVLLKQTKPVIVSLGVQGLPLGSLPCFSVF